MNPTLMPLSPRAQETRVHTGAVPAPGPDRLKVLVLGHAQHGKDTAAEILRDAFNLSFTSSSYFLMPRAVFPILSLTNGYQTLDECYADRGNHREVWRRLIKAYNTPDLSRLTREILAEHDIYVGMRDAEEFEASRHLFDLILWIDASARKPEEPSMHIAYEPREMVHIENNGPLEQMRTQLQLVVGARLNLTH